MDWLWTLVGPRMMYLEVFLNAFHWLCYDTLSRNDLKKFSFWMIEVVLKVVLVFRMKLAGWFS